MDRLLMLALCRAVKRGRLVIQTAHGDRFECGDGQGDPVELRFHDVAAQWGFLCNPNVRFGELYMDGRVTVGPGLIYDVMFMLMQDNREHRAPMLIRTLDHLRAARQRYVQRNTVPQSKRNVARHYDLDVKLYQLFLDDDLQYSCAYFEHADQSLNDAQLAKKRHIASKLLLEAGQSVLDIGCGWGGMAFYLSRVAGAGNVLGITLSEEQVLVARERLAQLKRGGEVAFAIADYREIRGEFDRIVSVGMFEHVGVRYYGTYFKQCRKLLAEHGIMVMQTIGCLDGPGYVTPWVTKYIFPGGSIPALSDIIAAVERARLVVNDVEVLQDHYALTIRIWRQRFLARRNEALELYGERFCRMWEYYLAAAEVAFRCDGLVVFQIQLGKKPALTPITRGYIDAKKRELIAKETAITVV